MPKLEDRRVLLDRMPTFVGEETLYLHEGQWAKVRPVLTQRSLVVTLELLASDYGQRANGLAAMEPEEAASEFRNRARERERVQDLLAELVTEINLTAYDGTELPQPREVQGRAFDLLTQEEASYLAFAVLYAVQRPGLGDIAPELTPPTEAQLEEADRD